MSMSYNCVNVKVICVYPCQCQISVSMLRSSLSINVKVNYLCEWQWVFSSELQQHWNVGLWQSPNFVNLVCFLKNGIVVQYLIIKMAQNLRKEIRFAWYGDSREDIKLTKCESKQTQVILEIWMHVSLCLLRQFNLCLYFWAAIAIQL